MNKSGFTLLEVIVSMIIAGVIIAVAGIGIIMVAKSYLLTKENVHIAQKVQLAFARVNRELMELSDITDASGAYVAFESISGNRTIGFDGGDIKIAEGSVLLENGDVLIDDIIDNGFTLTYKKDDDQTDWVHGTDDIKLLASIEIELSVSRPDDSGGSISFSTTIIPRNTKKR